ncbi:PilZ domain-containing protein, partial [Pantoea agglomerans]|uniref:PilZ domain-containing protein n=1 Tax=Enterobacter agglomerans TaxID=549 RepID=UPI003CEDE9FE
KAPINGKLLDISATGCKLRFEGDITDRLQLGQVYDRLIAPPLFGNQPISVEVRYLHFEEKLNITFAGLRFHNISGQAARNVERFVYQLQR